MEESLQMNTILGFKTLEDEELEDHACSGALRGKMLDFHGGLMDVISIGSLEQEEHGGEINPNDLKPSVWKTILKVNTVNKYKCQISSLVVQQLGTLSGTACFLTSWNHPILGPKALYF